MSARSSSPNRRRGIAVAIIVSVLISLVVWWSWPRADGRFVGKWVSTLEGRAAPFLVYDLQPGGRGTYEATIPGGRSLPSRGNVQWWTVEGHVIVKSRQPGVTGFIGDIASSLRANLSSPPEIDGEMLDVETTEAGLELRLGRSRSVRFRRVSE